MLKYREDWKYDVGEESVPVEALMLLGSPWLACCLGLGELEVRGLAGKVQPTRKMPLMAFDDRPLSSLLLS